MAVGARDGKNQVSGFSWILEINLNKNWIEPIKYFCRNVLYYSIKTLLITQILCMWSNLIHGRIMFACPHVCGECLDGREEGVEWCHHVEPNGKTPPHQRYKVRCYFKTEVSNTQRPACFRSIVSPRLVCYYWGLVACKTLSWFGFKPRKCSSAETERGRVSLRPIGSRHYPSRSSYWNRAEGSFKRCSWAIYQCSNIGKIQRSGFIL